MIRNALGAVATVGLLLIALIAHGSTALATHDVSHAAEQIDQIVAQADTDMQQVVEQFATDVPTAATESELAQMEADALGQLDSIKAKAKLDLDATVATYPELKNDSAAAKADLNARKGSHQTEIKQIADNAVPGGATTTTTTTTTTVPPPTTTITTTTTTTVPPPTTTTTTTTVPPPTTPTTTTVPPQTTTTTIGPVTTTTFVPPSAPQPPRVSGGQPPAETGPIDQALAPLDVFDDAESTTGTRSGGTDSALSGSLVNSISVVLPPQVATAIVSPLIVLEILLHVLFDSVQALILPALLLAVALIWMLRRRPAPDEPARTRGAVGL